MSDKLELGTKQDLEMLISDLDNFYSYRGRKFFKLLDEDDRIDLEEKFEELNKETITTGG